MLLLSLMSSVYAQSSGGTNPVKDTRISVTRNIGKFLWLDEDTLAITTPRGEENKFWDSKIVAVSAASGKVTTILERGFLNCVDPSNQMVALVKGSQASSYYPPDNAPGLEPTPLFLIWNKSGRRFEKEEGVPHPTENWLACVRSNSQDSMEHPLEMASKTYRLLSKSHGSLRWGTGEGGKVMLVSTDGVSKMVALSPREIAPVLQYLPFANRYLVSSGRVFLRGTHVKREDEVLTEIPLTTLSPSGLVGRENISATMKKQLEDLGATDPFLLPVARGTLIAGNGLGIYLKSGEILSKMWCESPYGNSSCNYGQGLEVSPDGCKVAFAPSGYSASVRIVDLCRR